MKKKTKNEEISMVRQMRSDKYRLVSFLLAASCTCENRKKKKKELLCVCDTPHAGTVYSLPRSRLESERQNTTRARGCAHKKPQH